MALMEERSHRTRITQDMVIDGLLREARNYGEGASHSARVSAWTQLGKHLGMFVDRRVVGLKRIEDMSEEEVLILLGGEPEEEEMLRAVGRA